MSERQTNDQAGNSQPGAGEPVQVLSGQEYRDWVEDRIARKVWLKLSAVFSLIGIGGVVVIWSFLNANIETEAEELKIKVEEIADNLGQEIKDGVTKYFSLEIPNVERKLMGGLKTQVEATVANTLMDNSKIRDEVMKTAEEKLEKDLPPKMIDKIIGNPVEMKKLTEKLSYKIEQDKSVQKIILKQISGGIHEEKQDPSQRALVLQFMLALENDKEKLRKVLDKILNSEKNPKGSKEYPDELWEIALKSSYPWTKDDPKRNEEVLKKVFRQLQREASRSTLSPTMQKSYEKFIAHSPTTETLQSVRRMLTNDSLSQEVIDKVVIVVIKGLLKNTDDQLVTKLVTMTTDGKKAIRELGWQVLSKLDPYRKINPTVRREAIWDLWEMFKKQIKTSTWHVAALFAAVRARDRSKIEALRSKPEAYQNENLQWIYETSLRDEEGLEEMIQYFDSAATMEEFVDLEPELAFPPDKPLKEHVATLFASVRARDRSKIEALRSKAEAYQNEKLQKIYLIGLDVEEGLEKTIQYFDSAAKMEEYVVGPEDLRTTAFVNLLRAGEKEERVLISRLWIYNQDNPKIERKLNDSLFGVWVQRLHLELPTSAELIKSLAYKLLSRIVGEPDCLYRPRLAKSLVFAIERVKREQLVNVFLNKFVDLYEQGSQKQLKYNNEALKAAMKRLMEPPEYKELPNLLLAMINTEKPVSDKRRFSEVLVEALRDSLPSLPNKQHATLRPNTERLTRETTAFQYGLGGSADRLIRLVTDARAKLKSKDSIKLGISILRLLNDTALNDTAETSEMRHEIQMAFEKGDVIKALKEVSRSDEESKQLSESIIENFSWSTDIRAEPLEAGQKVPFNRGKRRSGVKWFKFKADKNRQYTLHVAGGKVEYALFKAPGGLGDEEEPKFKFFELEPLEHDSLAEKKSVPIEIPQDEQTSTLYLQVRPSDEAVRGAEGLTLSLKSRRATLLPLAEAKSHDMAGEIKVNQPYRGNLVKEADQVWVKFRARKGKNYTITTPFSMALELGTDFSVPELLVKKMNLYQPSNFSQPIKTDENLIEWTCDVDGEYFVHIPLEEEKRPFGFVVWEEEDAPLRIPDGETLLGSVMKIEFNRPYHGNLIHQTGQWVKFRAHAGNSYTIETLRLTGKLDTSISLYAASSDHFIEANDDSSSFTMASRIEFAPKTESDYLVHIEAMREQETGHFDLLVKEELAPRNLAKDRLRAKAMLVDVNQRYRDSIIGPEGRWVMFRAFAGKDYTIEASSLTGEFDPLLRLFTARLDDPIEANDDSSDSPTASKIEFAPTTEGEYFVHIQAMGEEETGHFDLSVKEKSNVR